MRITIEKDRNHYEVSVHVGNVEIYGSFEDDEFVPLWFSSEDAEKYYEKNWALIDEQVNNLIYEVY
jgi:hypothetical protein